MVRRYREPSIAHVTVRGDLPLAVVTRLALVAVHIDRGETIPAQVLRQSKTFLDAYGPPPPEFCGLFGHGFGLRDCLALMLEHGDPALASWSDFRSFLVEQGPDWYADLLGCVVCNQLDLLNESASTSAFNTSETADVYRYARLFAREAEHADAIARLMLGPAALKPLLLEILDAYWRYAMKPQAADIEREITDYLAHLSPLAYQGLPSNVFPVITGRDAPPGERQRLDLCRDVMFLVSSGLGQEVSISYLDGRAVVAFEPCQARQLPEVRVDVFSALGNATRMRLLMTLIEQGEMYGTQLVDFLNEPQATVSNHLGILENAGLIGRRPDGRRVYFRFQPDGLENVSELIDYVQSRSQSAGWVD